MDSVLIEQNALFPAYFVEPGSLFVEDEFPQENLFADLPFLTPMPFHFEVFSPHSTKIPSKENLETEKKPKTLGDCKKRKKNPNIVEPKGLWHMDAWKKMRRKWFCCPEKGCNKSFGSAKDLEIHSKEHGES